MVDNMIASVELRLQGPRHEPRADPGGQEPAGRRGASTRCSAPGRCAARSSARSRTRSPRRCCTARSAPARSCWSTSRARARRDVHLPRPEGRRAARPAAVRDRRGRARWLRALRGPARPARGRAGAPRGVTRAGRPLTARAPTPCRSRQGVGVRWRPRRPARRRAGSPGSARRWSASCQAASSRRRGHRPVRVAQHGQQPAAALAVGAGPGLRLAGRAVVRRPPGGPPGAVVAQRARGRSAASRPCRPARRAPSPRPTRPRPAARRAAGDSARARSAAGDRRGRELPAADQARARTRRTLVSSTAWRRPKAKAAIAAAV